MHKQSVQKLTVSAVFAALILVSTMFLSIKLPNGYANLGDGFVIVGALLLGKYYGACAAAIGTGLADLFEGYALYAPATIIIKALMALVAALIFEAFKDKDKIKSNKRKIIRIIYRFCCFSCIRISYICKSNFPRSVLNNRIRNTLY